MDVPASRTPRRKGHVRPSSTPGRAAVPASMAASVPPASSGGARAPLLAAPLAPPTISPTEPRATLGASHLGQMESTSSIVQSWTPAQCKAVLLAACESGYLGPAFLDHFEAVAVEEALLPPPGP